MIGSFDRDQTLLGLKRALPYIRLFRGRTFVIKLGGAAGADPEVLPRVIGQVDMLATLGIRIVLVHGGGPQITALSEKLGLEPRFVEGRRVTPPLALEAAVMAIAGQVNTRILAACRAQGLSAIGLSGVDAALIRAAKRPVVSADRVGAAEGIDYGEVGDVTAVDASVLDRLLDAGFLPVIASLAADDQGRVLNVNADTVAQRIAAALGAEKLIFLTEAPGILADRDDPGSLISYIDLEGLEELEANGALGGGMLPKTQAVRGALENGVGRVHVVGHGGPASLLAEVFTNEGTGTLVVRSISELLPAEHAAAAPSGTPGQAALPS
jgi:acetylglutamate kinase